MSRLASLLACVVLFLCAAGSARLLAAHCDALQEKYTTVSGASTTDPVRRLESFLHLLATTPDDPEDCVTTKIGQQISDIEKTLILLEIKGKTFQPDWVLACHSVNLRTGACQGAELDTSSSLPESRMGARLQELVPRSSVALLKLKAGYRAQIVCAYSDTGTGLKPMKIAGNRLPLGKLEGETKHLSVTVFLRREDSLRFRKVVWHLYPLEAESQP